MISVASLALYHSCLPPALLNRSRRGVSGTLGEMIAIEQTRVTECAILGRHFL